MQENGFAQRGEKQSEMSIYFLLYNSAKCKSIALERKYFWLYLMRTKIMDDFFVFCTWSILHCGADQKLLQYIFIRNGRVIRHSRGKKLRH